MKRIFILCIALCAVLTGFTQNDTIKVGGLRIVRKPGSKDREYKMPQRKRTSNIQTNWWIVDLGFANYNDNTVYSSTATQQYAPGSNSSWFALRGGKSMNVNIWFFMQRINMAKHVLN